MRRAPALLNERQYPPALPAPCGLLDHGLAVRVLDQLGLTEPPPLSLPGLERIYRAWCRAVPFDNVLRRIQIAQGGIGPLPGCQPEEFFFQFLAHGTGGPCTPTSQALCALLEAIGFTVARAPATITELHDEPVGHSTLIVALEGERYALDTAILCERPIPLVKTNTTIDDSLHPIAIEHIAETWRISYLSSGRRHPMTCVVFDTCIDSQTCVNLYHVTQHTRRFSGFNSALYLRLNRADTILTFIGQFRIETNAAGETHEAFLGRERAHALIEDAHLSSAIVNLLPPDA